MTTLIEDVRTEQVPTELRGAVLVVTLNRPDELTAWTPQMESEHDVLMFESFTGPDLDESVAIFTERRAPAFVPLSTEEN